MRNGWIHRPLLERLDHSLVSDAGITHVTAEDMTPEELEAAISQVEDLEEVNRGGQKVVYRCLIDGVPHALKVLEVPENRGDEDLESDEIVRRAQREVEILNACDSPNLVRLGPIPLSVDTFGDQQAVYFTEEWIDGANVGEIVQDHGPLDVEDLVRLAAQITEAIEILWELAKVHRDIKPANIMRRTETGDFVLLDMGLALDLDAESLTEVLGAIPGTPIYFSPERLELEKKRQLDFRSDLFSLGIVLYLAATGSHPFWRPGSSRQEALRSILHDDPRPPSELRDELPKEVDDVLGRLLQKRPHMRFRSCAMAQEAYETIPF